VIAVLCAGPDLAAASARLVEDPFRDIDGPFQTVVGTREGGRVTVYELLPATPGAAFAAVHIASRRGAERVLVFTEAWAAARALRDGRLETGTIAEPATVADGEPLVPWLRLAPDGSAGAGLPPRPDPARAIRLRESGGTVLLSLSRLPSHPRLVAAMAEEGVAHLFDTCAHGALEAARDLGIGVRLGAIVMGDVCARRTTGPLVREECIEAALAALG
jgi:hypothetical protein